jgi:DNA-binding IclR family transcriptional regulator
MKLARQTGDTAVLVVLDGDKAVDVASYQGDNVLQAQTRIGERNPLNIGASNKILLAYLPEPKRERIINEMELTQYTDKTITCRDKLRERLAEIRSQGYAVDGESYEVGVYAIGAPVRDHTGRVIAGVTVTTPRSRYSSQREVMLVRMVVDAANQISSRLAGLPEPPVW